jgi:undecaprenyl-diphosphatase
MDNLVNAIILSIIQGITEWLPVSSSGHLVLFEGILNYDVGLMFEVALHFGTLMAVFVYFGEDIIEILRELVSGRWNSERGRLGILIVIATIPVAIAGYFLQSIFESAFGSLAVTAIGFGITGMILLIASLRFKARKFGYIGACGVGLFQVISLFPGVSRSGSTISGGLLFGLKEKEAMKFSFLMSIPAIFGASILTIGNNTLPPELIWATLVSFVVGLIAIHLLYKKILTSRKNLRWFAAYTLLLALSIGIFLLVG